MVEKKRTRKTRRVAEALEDEIETTAVMFIQEVSRVSNEVFASIGRMIDSFDDYFTSNLHERNPELAEMFLDSRIQSINKVKEKLEQKSSELQKMKINIKSKK